MKRNFFLGKSKRVLGIVMAAAIAMTGIPFPASEVQASESAIKVSGLYGNELDVTSRTNETISIGNGDLTRTFEIENGKLKTGTISNTLGDSEFTPAAGSEEFVIRTVGKPGHRVEVPEGTLTSVRNSNWSITGDSVETGDGGGYAALLDGRFDTHYHSQYNGKVIFPAKLTLDRGANAANEAFQTVGYAGRKGDKEASTNGQISKFKLYASDSAEDLFEPKNMVKFADETTVGKVDMTGAFNADHSCNYIYMSLAESCNKRYVGFELFESQNGNNYAAGSELNLYTGTFDSIQGAIPGFDIKASELNLVKVTSETHVTEGGREGNEGRKEGKLLTFTFAPIAWGETEDAATIEQKVVMYQGDHYMRKWIEIKFDEDADKAQRIAYIDGEHLYTTPSTADLNAYRPANADKDKDIIWTIPANSGGIVEMGEAKADLGQPIYINGMFMGSEFPAAQNKIELADDTATTAEGKRLAINRYYTGKNLADLQRDDELLNQLTDDNKYVSWQTVVGASRSDGSNQSVVQQDFYSYIREIGTPSEFRIQYNSWFDNMMYIDDDNIMESFKDVDKNFVKTGVRPLDSYVVDDGWNQYRPSKSELQSADAIKRTGPADEINTDGFWTFNGKFPYELTTSSTFVQNMGSYFGVWIGPRGGYNFYGELANIISAGIDVEDKETGEVTHVQYGSKAGGSIDVADSRYIKKFAEMVVDWTNRFKVNYWKWDGFADNAQYNHFTMNNKNSLDAVEFNENNQHMIGGPNGIYHVTDLWEKWIYVMEEAIAAAEANGIDNLWISLTCYTNPSPWFLQWANSVWIQCTADQAEVSNRVLNDEMNNMLTYRDAVYYNFIYDHEFQFPLSNIYNHDPVYGKEGTGIGPNSMNGEQFRNNLFMQSGRGTAFWELYYSHSIFNDEKYLINADYLEWAEENFDLLKHAIMIGGTPNSNTTLGSNGGAGNQYAYGFAGFSETEADGIVSMRNPATENKTLTFVLDEGIGVRFDEEYTMWMEHTYLHGSDKELATYLVNGKEATDNILHKGDEISITLKPGETQIWRLSAKRDNEAPVLDKMYFKDANTIQVRASERLYNENITFTVSGNEVDAANVQKMADLRTFIITLDEAMEDGTDVTVATTGATDRAGNALKASITNTYYTDNEVVYAKQLASENGVLSGSTRSITGSQGFTISAEVTYDQPEVELVKQGEEYVLGINKEGQPYFTVKGLTATSDTVMEKGKTYTLSGVRENNDQVRLYVNGQVSNAAYDADSLGYVVNAAKITYATGTNAVRGLTVNSVALAHDEVAASALQKLVNEIEANKDGYTTESWTEADMDKALADAKEALALSDEVKKSAAYDVLVVAYGKLVPKAVASKNYASGKEPIRGWVDGSEYNYANDRKMQATDGNKTDAGNYTIVGQDGVKIDGTNTTKPSYMQLDLGYDVKIDQVNLWRYWDDGRTYNATAVVVSDTPDFAEKEVLYYSHANVATEGTAAADSDIFELGVQPSNKLYAETSAGKVLYQHTGEGKKVSARYVRLYVQGKQGGVTENHICEFEVIGQGSDIDPYNLKDLQAVVDKAEAEIASGKYSKDSSDDLQTSVDQAKELIKTGVADGQGMAVVQNVINDLEAKMAALVANQTVSFNSVGGHYTPETQIVVNGNVATAPEQEPKKEGYDFLGWYLGDAKYDFASMVTTDLVLEAKWKLQTWTIKFDCGEEGSLVADLYVKKGSVATKPEDPTREGYDFTGWTLNGVPYNFTEAVTEDINLVAQWDVKTYEVTFDTDGGSEVEKQSIQYLGKVTKPETDPTKAEFNFVGWALDGKEYDFTTPVKGNITLTAVWEAYPVVEAPTVNVEPGVVAAGTEIALDCATEDAEIYYTLEEAPAEEPDNGEGTEPGTVAEEATLYDGSAIVLDADTTIKAYATKAGFTKSETVTFEYTIAADDVVVYTVSFNDAEGNALASAKTVEKGATVTKPADPTKEGYTFAGWTLEDKAYEFTAAVEEDMILTATWDKNVYTVSFNDPYVTAQEVKFEENAIRPEKDPVKEGFTFVDWYLKDAAYEFSTPVTENLELRPEWKQITYTVSFNNPYVLEQTVNYGDKVVEPKEPVGEVGKTFLGWFVKDTTDVFDFNTALTSKVVTGDKLDLVDTWEDTTYTVSFNDPYMTSLTVRYGETFDKNVLEVDNRDGYHFEGWYLNGEPYTWTDAPLTSDISLRAKWTPYYVVTIDNDNGTEADVQEVTHGKTATRPATEPSKDGYEFDGWFVAGATKEYNFTTKVYSDITLTAQYTKLHSVSFNDPYVVGQIVRDGEKAEEPEKDPIKAGYEFDYWREVGTTTEYDFDAEVTKDLALEAKWTKLHSVSFNDPYILGQTVRDGENATKPADPVKEGWVFDGWKEDGATAMFNFETDAVTKDLSLKAQWREIFTVSFNNADVTIASVSVADGDKVAAKDIPADPIMDGWTFLGWYVNNADGTKTAFDFDTPVTGNVALTAEWKRNIIIGDIEDDDLGKVEDQDELKELIWVSGIEDKDYNGGKRTQEFRVYDKNKKLVEGVDYTVSIKNNQKAYEFTETEKGYLDVIAEGNDAVNKHEQKATIKKFMSKAPQVVLKMKGIYTGTKTIYFQIKKADISDDKAFFTDGLTVPTGKKAQVPAVTVLWKETGKALKQNKEFTVTVAGTTDNKVDMTKAGTYTLTIEGADNFTGKIEDVKFTVEADKVALSKLKVKVKKVDWSEVVLTETGEGDTVSANDIAEKAIDSIKEGKKPLVVDGDYKVTAVENYDAVGTGYVIIEGLGKYTGTRRIAYTITGTAMSKVKVEGVNKNGYEYTGTPRELLKIEEKLEVFYKKNKNAEEKPLNVTTEEAEGDYSVTYQKNTNKGTATMILTGNPERGYTGTKKVTFRITAYDLSKENAVNVTLAEGMTNANGKVEYTTGGATPKVVVTTPDERTLEEGKDYTLSYKNNKKQGKAEVTVKGKGNYAKNATADFEIVKKVVTEGSKVVTISVKDKVEGTKNNNWKQSFKVLDINGKALGKKDFDKDAVYTVESVPQEASEEIKAFVGKTPEAGTPIPAGSVMKVTVKLDGDNYEGTISETYRILSKDHDISKATFKVAAKAYTGAFVELEEKDITKAELKISRVPTPLKYNVDYEIKGYEKNTNKGTAKVTFVGKGNFGGEKTVTFKIGARSVVENWWDAVVNTARGILN